MKPPLSALILIAISIAPAFSGSKPPVPQMKPCVAIDEAAVTSVIRIVQFVAKSDRQHGNAKRKEFYDRLPPSRIPRS